MNSPSREQRTATTPPNQRVEVFFDKDAKNIHDPSVPNWFYYWTQDHSIQIQVPVHNPSNPSQPIQQMMDINFWQSIDMPVYNPDNPSNPTYLSIPISAEYRDYGDWQWFTNRATPITNLDLQLGESSREYTTLVPIDVSDLSKGRYAPNYSMIIRLGEGCSKMCAHSHNISTDASGNITNVSINPTPRPGAPSWTAGGTGHEGVDCLYQVIIHEYEHHKIYRENWPQGYIRVDANNDGMNDYDQDGDGYSDAWEVIIGLDPDDPDDRYDLPLSEGYVYEEERCRLLEDAFQAGQLDQVDWSMSTVNNYQGKQWR